MRRSCFILSNDSVLVALEKVFKFFSLELEPTQSINLIDIVDGLELLDKMIHTTSGFMILASIDDLNKIESLGITHIDTGKEK